MPVIQSSFVSLVCFYLLISTYSCVFSSNSTCSVVLRVVKTPAHGTLTDLATGKPLVNGSLLSTPSISPYTAGLLVGYTGAPHYFNTPTVRFNGSSLSFDDGAGYSPNADDDVSCLFPLSSHAIFE